MVLNIYHVDSWLTGYDVLLQLIFAIVTFLLAFFSLKIYKLTQQRQTKFFSTAFIFISLAYFIQTILNFLIILKINESVPQIEKIQFAFLFGTLGLYTHIIFMITGFVILLFITFKTKKDTLLWLLLFISFFTIFLSENPLNSFFLLSTIYLLFISYYYLNNYLKNKQLKKLLITIAFIFLFLGRAHFMFIANHQIFYSLAHIFELIAYLLIFINLIIVKKKWKRKEFISK